MVDEQPVHLSGSGRKEGRTVAAKRSGEATTGSPGYLRTGEVADMLYVSPATVSRWAKEGKLPS